VDHFPKLDMPDDPWASPTAATSVA